MADLKMQEDVRTTDMAPIAKKVIKMVDVKVEVTACNTHARISPRDGLWLPIVVPLEAIQKKLRAGERVAFFQAEIRSTVGALELGERLPARKRW